MQPKGRPNLQMSDFNMKKVPDKNNSLVKSQDDLPFLNLENTFTEGELSTILIDKKHRPDKNNSPVKLEASPSPGDNCEAKMQQSMDSNVKTVQQRQIIFGNGEPDLQDLLDSRNHPSPGSAWPKRRVFKPKAGQSYVLYPNKDPRDNSNGQSGQVPPVSANVISDFLTQKYYQAQQLQTASFGAAHEDEKRQKLGSLHNQKHKLRYGKLSPKRSIIPEESETIQSQKPLGVTGETLNLRHVKSIVHEKTEPDQKAGQKVKIKDNEVVTITKSAKRTMLKDKTEKQSSKIKLDIDLLKNEEKIEIEKIIQFNNESSIFNKKGKFSNRDKENSKERNDLNLQGNSSKEYQVRESQPNMLSISFTESKESENPNSERRRQGMLDALRSAVTNSPIEFELKNLQSKMMINIDANYVPYEKRYEMLDPSTSSQMTNEPVQPPEVRPNNKNPKYPEAMQIQEESSVGQRKLSTQYYEETESQMLQAKNLRTETLKRPQKSRAAISKHDVKVEQQDFKDKLKIAAQPQNQDEMLEKESSDPVSHNGQEYLSQSRQGNIRTNLQTPAGGTEEGLKVHGTGLIHLLNQQSKSMQATKAQSKIINREHSKSSGKSSSKQTHKGSPTYLQKSDTVKTEFLRHQGSSTGLLQKSDDITPASKMATNQKHEQSISIIGTQRTQELSQRTQQQEINFKSVTESNRSEIGGAGAGCQADEKELDRMAESAEFDIKKLQEKLDQQKDEIERIKLLKNYSAKDAQLNMLQLQQAQQELKLETKNQSVPPGMQDSLPSPSMNYTEDMLSEQFQQMQEEQNLGTQIAMADGVKDKKLQQQSKASKPKTAQERVKKYNQLQQAHQLHKTENYFLDKEALIKADPKHMTFDQFRQHSAICYEIEKAEKANEKKQSRLRYDRELAKQRTTSQETKERSTGGQTRYNSQAKSELMNIQQPNMQMDINMDGSQFELPKLDPEQLFPAQESATFVKPPHKIFYQQLQPRQIHLDLENLSAQTAADHSKLLKKPSMEIFRNESKSPISSKGRTQQDEEIKSRKSLKFTNMNPVISSVNLVKVGQPKYEPSTPVADNIVQNMTFYQDQPNASDMGTNNIQIHSVKLGHGSKKRNKNSQSLGRLDNHHPHDDYRQKSLKQEQFPPFNDLIAPIQQNKRGRRYSWQTRQLFQILKDTYMFGVGFHQVRNQKFFQKQKYIKLQREEQTHRKSQKAIKYRLDKERKSLINKDEMFDQNLAENQKFKVNNYASLDRLRELQLEDAVKEHIGRDYGNFVDMINKVDATPSISLLHKHQYLCSLRPEHILKLNYEQKEYEERLKNKIRLDLDNVLEKRPQLTQNIKRQKKRATKSLGSLIATQLDRFKQEQNDSIGLAGKKIELTIHPNFIDVIDPKVLKQQATNYLLYKLQELDQQMTFQGNQSHEILDQSFLPDQQNQPTNQTYLQNTECAPSRMTEIQNSPSKSGRGGREPDQYPIQIIEEDLIEEITTGNPTMTLPIQAVSERHQSGDKKTIQNAGSKNALTPMRPLEVNLNIDGIMLDKISQLEETDELTQEQPSDIEQAGNNNVILSNTAHFITNEESQSQSHQYMLMPHGQVAYGEGSPILLPTKTSHSKQFELSQGKKMDTSHSGLRQSASNISSKLRNDGRAITMQQASINQQSESHLRLSKESLYQISPFNRLSTTQKLSQNFVKRINITKSDAVNLVEEDLEETDRPQMISIDEKIQLKEKKKNRRVVQKLQSDNLILKSEARGPTTVFLTQQEDLMYMESPNQSNRYPNNLPESLKAKGLNLVMGLDNKKLKSELKVMKQNLKSSGSNTDPLNLVHGNEYKMKEQDNQRSLKKPEYSLGPGDSSAPVQKAQFQEQFIRDRKLRMQTAIMNRRSTRRTKSGIMNNRNSRQFQTCRQSVNRESTNTLKDSFQRPFSPKSTHGMIVANKTTSTKPQPMPLKKVPPQSTRALERRDILLQMQYEQETKNQLVQGIKQQIHHDFSRGMMKESGNSLFAGMDDRPQFKKDRSYIQHIRASRAIEQQQQQNQFNSEAKLQPMSQPLSIATSPSHVRASQAPLSLASPISSVQPMIKTTNASVRNIRDQSKLVSLSLSGISGSARSTKDNDGMFGANQPSINDLRGTRSEALGIDHHNNYDDFLKMQDQELFGGYMDDTLGIDRLQLQKKKEEIQRMRQQQADQHINFLSVKSLKINDIQQGMQPRKYVNRVAQRYNKSRDQDQKELNKKRAVHNNSKKSTKILINKDLQNVTHTSKQVKSNIPILNFDYNASGERHQLTDGGAMSKQETVSGPANSGGDNMPSMPFYQKSQSLGETEGDVSKFDNASTKAFILMSQKNGISNSKRLLGDINDDLMVVGKSGIASKRESEKPRYFETKELKKELEVVSVQTPTYSRNVQFQDPDEHNETLNHISSRQNMRIPEQTAPNTNRDPKNISIM